MRQQKQLQAQHTAAAQQVASASLSPIPFSPLPQQQQEQRPQQQPLVPQPTALGSNNPFAPPAPRITANNPFAPPSVRARSAPHPSTSSSASAPPRERDVSFSIPEREREERRGDEQAYLRPFSTGSQPPRRRVRESEDARLAGLFASYTGDGVDTFGNVGQLRCVFLGSFWLEAWIAVLMRVFVGWVRGVECLRRRLGEGTWSIFEACMLYGVSGSGLSYCMTYSLVRS